MQIHDLPELSGTPAVGSKLAIDDGATTYAVSVSALGAAIITAVTTTISNVTQTVKAAIEALTARVTANESSISGVDARLTTAESNIETTAQTVAGIDATQDELAAKVSGLETGAEWTDVKSSITFSPGTNCRTCTLLQAYRAGNLLFLRFSAAPNDGLSAGGNVDITVSGITPRYAADYRLGFAIIGVGFYAAWMTTNTNIRCRFMSSSTWSSTNSPIFTALLPLA